MKHEPRVYCVRCYIPILRKGHSRQYHLIVFFPGSINNFISCFFSFSLQYNNCNIIFQHPPLRLLKRSDGKDLKMPCDTQGMFRLRRSIHVLHKTMGKKTQCRGCCGFALLFSWEPSLCKKLEVKWSLVKSYLNSSIV